MRALRLLITAVFAVALVPLVAGAANAVPPTNDEFPGALPIHLGDEITQDTTQATTNVGDDALNANCGAPATNASVWYVYTPGADRNVGLDTSASDYGVGMMIFQGTPTPDSLISCGPVLQGLQAKAGQTYYIMVFSDNDVIGGNLVLTLKSVPTPLVHATLSKHGQAFKGRAGAASVHGTYKCRHGEGFAGIQAHLGQRAGRLKISGDGFTSITCDGAPHPWSVRIVSPVGTYAKGPARAKIVIFACGLVQCRHAVIKRDVTLAWANGAHQKGMTRPTKGLEQRAHPLVSRHWPS